MSHAEAQRRYERSPKGKATSKRYRMSLKGKARANASLSRRYHYTSLGEQVRERARQWYLKNKERKLLSMRAYYAKMVATYGSKKMAFWGRLTKEST